ncbi:MAG TPA: OmpH family outer membrane protein [Bryobacteraceae bacterium]|nr:OmpH family outer membrane protein [Bryobacteraceae bacterium]
MKKNFVAFSALALGMAMLAHAQSATPSKVAIIHVQNAILATKDGQKAQNDLQATFNPRKQEFEKKQADLQALQEQMKKGSATMSDDAKAKIARDIDSGSKSLQRYQEDFESDVQQAEQRIMQDLGQKMMDVIIKYATQNGYAMVVDVSNPQTPVLWADPAVDITNEIVKLYDQAHPGSATATTAKPAGSAPAAAPKPPAAPAVKK